MSERDPAAGRWAALQVVRLLGVATALVGLLHQAGKFAPLAGIPAWFGYVLIGVGLVETFWIPALLARRWRSQPRFDDAQDTP